MGFIFYYGRFPGLELIELYSEEGEGDFAEWKWSNREVSYFFFPL